LGCNFQPCTAFRRRTTLRRGWHGNTGAALGSFPAASRPRPSPLETPFAGTHRPRDVEVGPLHALLYELLEEERRRDGAAHPGVLCGGVGCKGGFFHPKRFQRQPGCCCCCCRSGGSGHGYCSGSLGQSRRRGRVCAEPGARARSPTRGGSKTGCRSLMARGSSAAGGAAAAPPSPPHLPPVFFMSAQLLFSWSK
jgi:hypothetical protein